MNFQKVKYWMTFNEVHSGLHASVLNQEMLKQRGSDDFTNMIQAWHNQIVASSKLAEIGEIKEDSTTGEMSKLYGVICIDLYYQGNGTLDCSKKNHLIGIKKNCDKWRKFRRK
ncbi:hypothetical protein IGL76_002173 [Enterococcus sp. DIV2381]